MQNTILIVEDYEDTRRIYKLMLEQCGFRVVEASDGYEAIESTKKEHPDLILMDMSLPSMDGLSAMRRIKEMESAKEVPVIGMTAHGNFYNVKAIKAGCDLVISKPLDMTKLETVVSLYLKY
jgi:CheY-like chemotaxis protein